MLVIFVYAVLGLQLFTFIERGDGLSDYTNFDSFGNALLLLFQCLTGDGWSAIMLTMAGRPNGVARCDADLADESDETAASHADLADDRSSLATCGSWLAYPYFISYALVGCFVFLNLVLAVVLEEFLSLWRNHTRTPTQRSWRPAPCALRPVPQPSARGAQRS